MCGICGIISKTKDQAPDLSKVKKMNNELVHRGPNSEGYFSAEGISIGMRRLSIIDLDHGSQPLYNEDKTITLIANGEIYNFIELRDTLISLGHKFSTGSDCETIIHTYEEYGSNFLDHLRGMFAFCLHDKNRGIVILARDRIGEKPLYIYEDEGVLTFSSELKSLIKTVPNDKLQLNKDSYYYYFLHGYFPPNQTPFVKIRKLLPGHFITVNIEKGTTEEKRYWNMTDAPVLESDPITAVRSNLDELEKIIIRADVPVGISLSGGIDSSIIASLASKYSDTKLHAFSVGYPGYPENDERKVARKLADELGLIFHDIEISEKNFTEDLEKMVNSMDEPIADIAAYGYYSVSREARKENVPVLLAGFGGDELFWGYTWARNIAKYNDLKQTIFGKIIVFTRLISDHIKQIPRKPIVLIKLFGALSFSSKLISYQLNPQWLYIWKNSKDIFDQNFLRTANRDTESKGYISEENGLKVTEALASDWLVSNCIDLGDRMSMAHAVELRLPLLDYKLFETVVGLRKKYPKDYSLGYKHWLIKATRDLLPKEIFERKKRGFTPPTQIWIKQSLLTYSNLLVDGYSVRNKLINKAYIKKALSNPDKHSKFLYSLLVFELWSKTYLK